MPRSKLASRQVATRSSAGLPERWADAIRVAAAPPGADLTDSLDRAVATVDLAYRRPLWWAVAGALQLLLAVAAVLGLLWLGVLGVVAWLQLPGSRDTHAGAGAVADATAARWTGGRAADRRSRSPASPQPPPGGVVATSRVGSVRPWRVWRTSTCSTRWRRC